MWFAVAFIPLAALVGLLIWRSNFKSRKEEALTIAKRRGNMSDEDVAELANTQRFPVPGFVFVALTIAFLIPTGVGVFNQAFFYAEPGYRYHVRTIFGNESVIDDVGYNAHMFGRVNQWKKALSVVAEENLAEADAVSAVLNPLAVTFLDQVDADISATARFRLPDNPEQFLTLVHEYRTEENLLRTTLVPAFRETVRATGALMGAEDYFSGAQTQFNIDFEDQLDDGLYIVRRREVVVNDDVAQGVGTADASLGVDQGAYGNDERVVFEVTKVTNRDGEVLRKEQSFQKFGITIAEARVTNVVPNDAFIARMGLKQQASADRAIAREQRVQEEEQRLLADTRGERQVAEQRAESLVEQIRVTTDAETQKRLAVTNAQREKERAEIEREQAAILLEKARIDGEAKTVAADAEAYAKRAVIEADNALQQKLDTLEAINKAWAEAYAKRSVPSTVFGSGGQDMTSDTGAQTFMDIMTMKAAKDLDVDISIDRN